MRGSRWEIADPSNPTPDETRQLDARKSQAARAYAKIVLRLEDDNGEVIATIFTDPHNTGTMHEGGYGS